MSAMQSTPRRPASGTVTGRVWDIADEITRATGRPATRAAVVKQAQAEGGNYNTASTQYHHWRLHNASTATDPASARPLSVSVQVKEAGRILLPAEVRVALGVGEGDKLVGEVIDGELRLMSQRTAIRQVQALVRQYVPAGVSLVDELIKERREEARREALE